MRTLLRLVLRLFPDDTNGILRGDMEETFMDGYRRSPSPFRYAWRELWSLLRNGLAERVGGWSGSSPRSPRSPGDGILSTLRDDVRLAFRKLSRSVGFTSAAVLTLALGIGATVAMFSILQAALLRSQLYQVGTLDPLTFASVAVGFVVAGVSASLLPARRATRVDPVRAMQVE